MDSVPGMYQAVPLAAEAQAGQATYSCGAYILVER